MKKYWMGFAILLVASVTVYGVVSSVSASSTPQAISADVGTCSEKGECPFSKQTAEAKAGCCASAKVEQTAATHGQGTQGADSCCESKSSAETTAQTAINAKVE